MPSRKLKNTGQQKVLDWPKVFSINKQTTSSSKARFSYQERSRRSQELRKHIDLQINQIVRHDKFFLHEEVKNFQVGNISKHVKAWEKIATDSYIPDTVKNGIKMIVLTASVCDFYPHKMHSKQDCDIIQAEICKLLSKGLIIPTEREDDFFFKHFY